MIILTEYQEKAVDFITSKLSNELENPNNHTITLKATTGSGKTIMAGQIMQNLIEEHDKIAFFWASVSDADLWGQSIESIDDKFQGIKAIRMQQAHFTLGMIPQVVYGFGWQSVSSSANVFRREGDKYNFTDFLNKTREKGIKIMLVVDESHKGAGKDTNIQEVKDLIDADVTLNISATPKTDNIDYEVDEKDVIKEQIIKKGSILNDGIENHDTEHNLNRALACSIDKLDQLAGLYKKENSLVNPLCMIQLPNGADEAKIGLVESFLASKGYTYDNGKVSLWLSGDKGKKNFDKSTIKNFDSTVRFLLFKVAAATGWDCTRAHILVKLRDVKSKTLDIQTFGRIRRMPERKHYINEALNFSYIYSDAGYIPPGEDLEASKNQLKTKISILKDNIDLELSHSFVKETRTFSQLYRNLLKPILTDKLDHVKDKIEWDTSNINQGILSRRELTTNEFSDEILGCEDGIASPAQIEFEVFKTIKDALGDYGKKRSTLDTAKIVIEWITNIKGWDRSGGINLQLKVIANQTEPFVEAIVEAMIEYKVPEKDVIDTTFTPEPFLYFPTEAKARPFKKYAYTPALLKFDSNMEEEFALSLERDENVDWWIKNGNSGTSNFSIINGTKNFYPDFIILYNTGELKIVETKGGIYHEESKREALTTYGKKHGILTEYILE